jgi:hypothetical protein
VNRLRRRTHFLVVGPWDAARLAPFVALKVGDDASDVALDASLRGRGEHAALNCRRLPVIAKLVVNWIAAIEQHQPQAKADSTAPYQPGDIQSVIRPNAEWWV